MVYIYGGGDSIDQISDSAYDPTTLISGATTKGMPVIYVAMNYRVGLLDRKLGLNWVQKHISAFGGDPDNVTIFGESDGATGVGLQITAYAGKEKAPFQRAIMQSGNPAADAGNANNLAIDHTAQLIRTANCTASTSTEELACLRKVPLRKLLPAAVELEYSLSSFGISIFIPTASSSLIPDAPSKLLRSGRFTRNIDMMLAGTKTTRPSSLHPPSIRPSAWPD